MITGRATSSRTARACSTVWAMPDAGTSSPMPTIASLNCWRSSAVAIASALAPISSGPADPPMTPRSCSAIATLRAVCPPSVGSTASGRSRSMILASTSGVSGSMYVRSAKSGSVMIVAGLELASTTR